MNLPRVSARFVTARSLRGVGASYPAARFLSLWAWPWKARRRG